MSSPFKGFGKISRLNRQVIVTEKIDGTNACVVVTDDGVVTAQSRSRIITPEDDNFGFAVWVQKNAEELRKLGSGYHYGEWWGQGIQRNYGMTEKVFSLFNVSLWMNGEKRPACCRVVPPLAVLTGFAHVGGILDTLRRNGSVAAPGFMQPEGIIAYHVAGGHYYKATSEKDEEYKGKSV
jgi:hypothetical protein